MKPELDQIMQKMDEIIHSIRGMDLSIEERTEMAIDLTALMIEAAQHQQTKSERNKQELLACMMEDPSGKNFAMMMTDQIFRTSNSKRAMSQFRFLLKKFGIPSFLAGFNRWGFTFLSKVGRLCPRLSSWILQAMMRRETSDVIMPGESKLLHQHLKARLKNRVRINLNRLGEAILGEKEALNRFRLYLQDLKDPDVEVISIKISSIFSQINLLDWDNTLHLLKDRLKMLYRTAKKYSFNQSGRKSLHKFVNLDMEEYRDLRLTVDLFKEVLDDPEFFDLSAGIALQSYIPDSFAVLEELTDWAIKRVEKGGSPIKVRIVKGANLGMERIEASLKGWEQSPFKNKVEVDAHFKKMLHYAVDPKHCQSVRIGVASHNLFDIAYALLLRAEKGVEPFVCFEMLEGMANHLTRIVQAVSQDILLYCPAAKKDEFHTAMAYLIRRLDENTAPQNFLRHLFSLSPGTAIWNQQVASFRTSCLHSLDIQSNSRRKQNRWITLEKDRSGTQFTNESDTDWSLEDNRKWAKDIIKRWDRKTAQIPLCIDGQFVESPKKTQGKDPSHPTDSLYEYSLASLSDVNKALESARTKGQNWALQPVEAKAAIFRSIAEKMRKARGTLIGCMLADVGKPISESDGEISEAVDFAEYYACQLDQAAQQYSISSCSNGIAVVASPWNFPCSIPAGGILAALASGYSVLFKPAPESIWVGWELVNLFWEAGIPKETLQFLVCEDEPEGSYLIQDRRVDIVILTGATATARKFLNMRPDLRLFAETGGKNSIIVTALADRDLAVKDIVQSAFGYSGQKCSACSLVILEKEVYEDENFLMQLVDAAESLRVGSAWDLGSRVVPLIREPSKELFRALTVCDEGEEWLLKPKVNQENPQLWSPGIKLGVKPGSFMHQIEFFGPILGVMCAENLSEAIDIANTVPYGLTAGLHSLDQREHDYWLANIQAGNCYINRGITGAIVGRQPFGGCKASSFGIGMKAGGPNYLAQLLPAKEERVSCVEGRVIPEELAALESLIKQTLPTNLAVERWKQGTLSYWQWWNDHFSKQLELAYLIGQDNLLSYQKHPHIFLYLSHIDQLSDLLLVFSAASITDVRLSILSQVNELSASLNHTQWRQFFKVQGWEYTDSLESWVSSIQKTPQARVRSFPSLPQDVGLTVANYIGCLDCTPANLNGRLELLHFVREVSFSIDYHRYGNLQDRETEQRKDTL